MKKRAISALLCLLMLFFCLPVASMESKAEIDLGFDFGDRIIYGGYAVDVGENTIVSKDGALFIEYKDGENKKIADINAKYLNYAENKLFFVCDNKIMTINPNGTDIKIIRSFDEAIKCLYVMNGKMMYLKDETVFLLDGNDETAVLTRDGIKGFAPESDGTIRWVKDNPNYEFVAETGDEFYGDSQEQYLQYIATPNSAVESDTVYAPEYNATAYTGPTVKVGNISLPMPDHMPGTYFTKNGKACTCHNTSSNYCINSVGNCNCMRYYPTGKADTCEIDLLGAQCFAFSRLVFYKCFGFIDHSMNSSLYYSVGSLASGSVTKNNVKTLLNKAKAGAHVRLARGHSVSILAMDEDYLTVYHANSGGDNVTTSPCIISTKRYTWEYFATYAAAGISYVNMPYNYPSGSGIASSKPTGYYKLTSNLNLRADSTTSSDSLGVVPIESVVKVLETTPTSWGKIQYNGITGWIFLEYATYQSYEKLTPTKESVKRVDGYLKTNELHTVEEFSACFDQQTLVLTSPSGKTLASTDSVTTGTTVSLKVDSKTIEKLTLIVAGDVDKDGNVNVNDYVLTCRVVKRTYELDTQQTVAADVSGNGTVDASDYILIKRKSMTRVEGLFKNFM